VTTALIIVRQRALFAVIMLAGIYSLLGAAWMLALDAPDVAFTEAAVGAGISTVLMLATLALTSPRDRRTQRFSPVPLLAVLITGAALIYGTMDMPHFGDPQAPAHLHVAPRYIEESPEEIGIPNMVTSVLASYRGYDTLGETIVIFTAGIAVLLLLGGRPKPTRDKPRRGADPMQRQPVLRVVVKLLLPYILLFALYVQFHGEYGPGGGFQAGVIFAAGLILYSLIFGPGPARRVASRGGLKTLAAAGVLLYIGVGFAAILRGGSFLEYSVLAHEPVHGQHLGILLIELGVGVTVASVLLSIYFSFAERETVEQ